MPKELVAFADLPSEWLALAGKAAEGMLGVNAQVVLVLALIAAFVAIWGIAISGSVDALGQPRESWERAGFRRNRWVWQAFGPFFLPVALAYSGVYFVGVRPRLVAASRDLAIEQAAARVHLRPAETSAGPHVDIKIRIPPGVAVAIALPLVVGYSAGISLVALTADSGGASHWGQLSVWGLAVLIVVLGNMTFGVTLTPRDLVMRGLIRRHVVWSDVLAITQESMLGSRYVRLWTRTGRGHRLRAPFTQFGIGRRRFDTDFAVLEQWWLAHTPATN